MQYHEQFNICEKAIHERGLKSQALIAVEELSELITAICHMVRGREHNVPEEIADTEIMILQLKIAMDCCKEVEEQKEYKLRRLEMRGEETCEE